MKRITVLTGLTALLALWTIAVYAVVPQLINFQGILRDGSGNPVANGSYSVTFKIYDAPTGGTILWSETQSVTTTNGLFTVLLGAATPVPDSAFNDSSRYLGITVSPDPEMTPRQKLVSVPYSTGSWSTSGNGGTGAGRNFLGTTDNQALELKVNGSRALRLEPTGFTPNIIGGSSSNNVTSGVYTATIAGGGLSGLPNRVTDFSGTVSGGAGNLAGDDAGTVFDKQSATVGGGSVNVASGGYSTVSGGSNDTASGDYAVVCGGDRNKARGTRSALGGGLLNEATGYLSVVGGGVLNLASGLAATVGGGVGNKARGTSAVVSGGGNDSDPMDSNAALGDFSTVSGGRRNIASGLAAAVAGGQFNGAAGFRAAVGGGQGNQANNVDAAVAGGAFNVASGAQAVIGGGINNLASNQSATVGGGEGDTASGSYATVPGGIGNKASFLYSFAAGRRAKALHAGTFVWADSTDADFASTAHNQFLIRAANVGIGTNAPTKKLEVAGSIKVGTNDTIFSSNLSSNSPLRLQTAGMTRMYIDDATGNVGIGTTSPATLLTVNGTVTASSFAGSFGQSATTVFGTSGLVVSTTTLTLIPGLTQTLTVPSNSVLYIATDGGVQTSSASTTGFSTVDAVIFIDGSIPANGAYKRLEVANTGGVTSKFDYWSQGLAVVLAPGSHTIDVRAALISGSTATVSGSGSSVLQGKLTVAVIKQ